MDIQWPEVVAEAPGGMDNQMISEWTQKLALRRASQGPTSAGLVHRVRFHWKGLNLSW